MRVHIVIAYDGTNYQGYQRQPNGQGVQNVLEGILTKIHKGIEVKVHASGRTDTGVHAMAQSIHYDSPLAMDGRAWKRALNTFLPDDIRCKEAKIVDETFHARYDVVSKEYRYVINNCTEKDIFRRNYEWHIRYPLNIDEMKRAAKYLEGTHDFTAFCSMKSDKENKTRTIYAIRVDVTQNQYTFSFHGNGFLYNMVRSIMGALVAVGAGKAHPEDVEKVLKNKVRKQIGKTAPAHGLFLWKVNYD